MITLKLKINRYYKLTPIKRKGMSVSILNCKQLISEWKVNPKLLISQYFDSLINRVDIHTEELLGKYSSQQKMDNPDKAKDQPKIVLVWDFLNGTREKMIKRLSEAQIQAFEKLETIREDLKKDETTAEEIFEKLFADRFFFIIHDEKKTDKSTFKMFLIETYFYVSDYNMLILR